MKYELKSNFPNTVDTLTFFEDISIKDNDTLNQVKKLNNENKFTEGVGVINNSNAHSYSAGLFNMLEFKIRRLQDYLLRYRQKNILTVWQNEEPTDKNIKIWDLPYE